MSDITKKEVKAIVQAIHARAAALTITTDEEYKQAGGMLTKIKAAKARVKEVFGPSKDAAYTAYKAASALYKQAMDPIEAADKVVRREFERYSLEVKRRENAERMRLEAEARAQAEAERQAQVEILQETGQEELAEVLDQAPVVAAPVIVPEAVKPEGVHTMTRWKARVTDMEVLCKAIGAKGSPQCTPDLVLPNTVALNGLARALKSNLNIPGVEAYPETSAVTR